MKATFTTTEVPIIPAPHGTPAARAALGMEHQTETQRALFPVLGGFIGWGRACRYAVVSAAGDVRPLGIDVAHAAISAMPAVISPDRTRLLIRDGGRAEVLAFADGTRRELGCKCTGAAWLDDARVVIADGKTLSVRSATDGSVLAKAAYGEALFLAARADGVIIAAFGDTLKPKSRAIEVLRVVGDTIEPVGRRAKLPFTIMVPFEGEIFLVEKAHFGNWVKCFRVDVALEQAKPAPAQPAPADSRPVARVSLGRRRDAARLEQTLASFAPKTRKKYKLDQLLDCTVADDGRAGFTVDAGGEQKTSLEAILEILQLPEIRALPGVDLSVAGRGALASKLLAELPAKGYATLTGLDVSSAAKATAALAKYLATAARLQRLVARDLGLAKLDAANLEALEALDLEDNALHDGIAGPLPSLRRLRLRNAVYAGIVDWLVQASWVPSLVELRLSRAPGKYPPISAASVVALAARLGALRELSLAGQEETGDEGVVAIARAAPGLEMALLKGTGVGARGIAALSRGCASLVELDAQGDETAAAGLADGGGGLERLSLTVEDAGAAALGKNADLKRVRRLAMLEGKLTPAGLAACTGSALFDGLTDLAIKGTSFGGWNKPSDPDHLGDAGAAMLAETPALSGLTRLRLEVCTIGNEGARALAKSPTLARLEILNVDWNPIPEGALVALLEELPALKKLTAQLHDKRQVERLREVAYRKQIELELFTGTYRI